MTNNVSNSLLGLLAPIYQDGGESVSRNKKKSALSRIKDGIKAVLSKITSGVESLSNKIQKYGHIRLSLQGCLHLGLYLILHKINNKGFRIPGQKNGIFSIATNHIISNIYSIILHSLISKLFQDSPPHLNDIYIKIPGFVYMTLLHRSPRSLIYKIMLYAILCKFLR